MNESLVAGSLAKKLVVIVGPTASGKSDLAMQVARKHRGEIICADSRTVYKGMDIGTAKPSAADMAEIPHHLVDVVEPNEPFTAHDFKRLALQATADITARGNTPIMVGGTGLYIDSVIFNYEFGEPADPARRTQLNNMTIEELQQFCRDNNIELPFNAQNKRHLIRAIEIGGLISKPKMIKENTIVVGINTDRAILRERVSARAQLMLKDGIVDEIRALAQKFGWESEAMTGNIYRVFRGVVEGTKTEDEAVEEFIRSDMSLAKRQMTWFKRNKHIHWGEPQDLLALIDDFLHVVKK